MILNIDEDSFVGVILSVVKWPITKHMGLDGIRIPKLYCGLLY